MMTISSGCVVAMRYSMRSSSGEEFEQHLHGTHVTYLHGGDSILPLLQQQLEGLKAGDEKQVSLRAQDASLPEDLFFDVCIKDVRLALPAEIMLGYPVQPPITTCNDNCECYRNF